MSEIPTLAEISEIGQLPVVLDVETAGRMLGIGRTAALRLARTGRFPCRTVRVGNLWRVPTADLLALLGLPVDTADPEPAVAPLRPAEPSTIVPFNRNLT